MKLYSYSIYLGFTGELFKHGNVIAEDETTALERLREEFPIPDGYIAIFEMARVYKMTDG